MKVLFVSDNAKLSNPFVETLIAGLYEFNLIVQLQLRNGGLMWKNMI